MQLVRLWQYQTLQLVCPQQHYNAIEARMDTTKHLQTLHQSRRSPLSCNRNSLAPLIKGRKRAAVPQTELALLQAGGAHNYAHDYIAHEEHLHTER